MWLNGFTFFSLTAKLYFYVFKVKNEKSLKCFLKGFHKDIDVQPLFSLSVAFIHFTDFTFVSFLPQGETLMADFFKNFDPHCEVLLSSLKAFK